MEKVRVIETEVQLASKPKVAAPEAPSIPLHIQHNLSKPVRSLEWKAGVGTISGLTDTFYQVIKFYFTNKCYCNTVYETVSRE